MAKKKPVQPQQSARQIRRQLQRQAASLAAQAAPVEPIPSSSDALGPSLLVPIFSSVVILGYLLFARGVATLPGNELSHHQSLFTAVNAASLTGFQQARNPGDYTYRGKVLTLLLMMSGMLFSLICGGMAVVRIARLRFNNSQVLAWAFGSVLITALGGGLAVQASSGQRLKDSIFLAVSAFGNCGLNAGPLPIANSGTVLLVLLPLAIVGGLGLPVLMDLFDCIRTRRELSQHSRTVLDWTAGSYLVITLILLLVRWPGTHASLSFWRSAFVQASQQSINARSAGFAFQMASGLPQAITFVLVIVMVIGASPAGSAGGLKVTTLAELARGTREALGGRSPGRPFGVAIIWLLVYLAMLTAATIALLMTEPDMHLDRSLFLAASALGNVGLSHDPVVVSTAGLYVLSATMMLGRVAPVMMLWYVVDTTPEATVAVG